MPLSVIPGFSAIFSQWNTILYSRILVSGGADQSWMYTALGGAISKLWEPFWGVQLLVRDGEAWTYLRGLLN
jgi:hypothetical protein